MAGGRGLGSAVGLGQAVPDGRRLRRPFGHCVDEQHRHRQERRCEKRPSFTRAAWLTRRAREITGCPRENGPGFGPPSETRQNTCSIVGMPACDTHPRERCARRLCESRPAAWRGPGNGASCPSRAPQGSCAHPLNTRPRVVIRESRHDHPRQVPLMAEATITCVMCGAHQIPVVLTGMPGSRSGGARRSKNGPCMKARGSPPGRWNLAGREPRQNMPRSAR